MGDTQNGETGETGLVSKSQRKRDMESLKNLGWRLLEFSDDALRQLAMPDKLLDAIRTAKRIKSHGARKRQMQFIGKLMRDIDAAPIRKAVDLADHQQSTRSREFHLIEDLREKLLTEGDSALPEVLSYFPRAERQYLRKLVRQAKTEQETRQPPRASRLVFRYLRELQEEPEY
jgi:ribosome-associated protein